MHEGRARRKRLHGIGLCGAVDVPVLPKKLCYVCVCVLVYLCSGLSVNRQYFGL